MRALVKVLVIVAVMVSAGFARESRAFAGEGGLSRSFTLIGGKYDIYVYAKNPSRSTYSGARRSCVFGGNLQQVGSPNNAIPFGNGVTVGSVIGYKLGPETISLPAGTYSVFVATATNCAWHVTLQSSDDNGAGVAGVQVGTDLDDLTKTTAKVSLRDQVQFLAQYRTDHVREVPVSGRLELIHRGRVMRTIPLKLGTDNDSLASVIYQVVKWEPGDAKLLGKNTARMVVTIDGKEYVSSADFDITQ
jgi:hypothetical protein